MATATQTPATAANVPAKAPKITDQVMGMLQKMRNAGRLDVPKEYSVANALNSAWLILQDTKDRNKRPVLQTCEQSSIVRALMNMAYLGLNPAKSQAYFIAYGNQLTLFVSYFGKMAIAKRVNPNILDITADVIYQGDRIVTAKKRGRTYISEHQHEWGNEDPSKIIGAYCTIIYRDGSEAATIMNMDEIRKCWTFGQTKGKSDAHEKTPDQMAMRTVINRALKPIINSSDDTTLLGQAIHEVEMDEARAERDAQIDTNTHIENVSFEVLPEPEPEPEPVAAAFDLNAEMAEPEPEPEPALAMAAGAEEDEPF